MESIVREKVIEHLNTSNTISNKQFGFLSGRSTVLQLLKVLDQWTEYLDEGSAIDVTYCDFMKAFDIVPHAHLIHKLKQSGVNGQTNVWIKGFLSNRNKG